MKAEIKYTFDLPEEQEQMDLLILPGEAERRLANIHALVKTYHTDSTDQSTAMLIQILDSVMRMSEM